MPVVYDGVCKYLLINSHDITEKVLHQDDIETAIMKELTMAEDLATTNVKLSIEIEKINGRQEELISAKNQLEELNKNLEQHVFERSIKLFESEAKQRALIDHAPVAIAVLKGEEHVIELANKKMAEYWGSKNGIIGLPLVQALPELTDQTFTNILNEVRNSGIPYVNPELKASLLINGSFQSRYYNLIYQPVQLVPGVTDSIYVVALDITGQIAARTNLANSESMLRLAVTAANIGTWSYNTQTGAMKYNAMFSKILGWESDLEMTYQQAVDQVTDEFKSTIVDVIETAIKNGENYDFTYAQKRFNDGQVVWLRSIGKVMLTDSGTRELFSGVLMEIPYPNSSR